MRTNKATRSAMESLEVYLSARAQPETLRVSNSGDLEIASNATLVFERATHLLGCVFIKNHKPPNWEKKALEALLQKFEQEITTTHGTTLSDDDKKDLADFLANIKGRTAAPATSGVREIFSRQLSSLQSKNKALSSSLEKIFFLGNPKNTKLFKYVQERISNKGSFRHSLESGIATYLSNELDIDKNHAEGLAKNISYLMINYKVAIDEALEILKTGSNIKNKNYKKISEGDLLPLAYLMTHHKLPLGRAVQLKQTIESKGNNNQPLKVMDARPQIAVMLTYEVNFRSADLIVKKVNELKKNNSLRNLSSAQLTEIAKLTVENNKSVMDATQISLQAGHLLGEIPVNREEKLRNLITALDRQKEEKLTELLPTDWYDSKVWEPMPDGSRRLKNIERFRDEIMLYLKNSFESETKTIDQETGLAEVFTKDVGRQKFNFDGGKTETVVRHDPAQAKSALEQFAPDPEIRKTLSKTLYQAGGNSIDFAMTTVLKDSKNFSIKGSDAFEQIIKGGSETWIELRQTDEKKIHVTYIRYMKHIALKDEGSPYEFLSINPQLSRDMPASAQNHSGKASVTIELDPEDLKKGIVNPVLVGDPVITLTIDIH